MKFFSANPSSPSFARKSELPRRGALAIAGLAGLWLAAGAAAQVIITPPPPPPPPQIFIDHSALWQVDAPATTLFYAQDLADLTNEMQQLQLGGLRLNAFESWSEGGVRRFAGLFRQGKGARTLFLDLDAAGFEWRRDQQAFAGQRLYDLEVQMVGGQRRYSGLWGPGNATEIVLDGLEAEDFEAQVQALSLTHDLVLFDTWVENDEARAYGVLRPSAADSVVVIGRTWLDFAAQLQNFGWMGYQLVDIDIAAHANAENHYSGRWVWTTPRLADWLGVYYTENELTNGNLWLTAGYGTSGVSLPEGSVVFPPQPEWVQYLNDLEVSVDSCACGIFQAKPISDTGTPGPPRG